MAEMLPTPQNPTLNTTAHQETWHGRKILHLLSKSWASLEAKSSFFLSGARFSYLHAGIGLEQPIRLNNYWDIDKAVFEMNEWPEKLEGYKVLAFLASSFL